MEYTGKQPSQYMGNVKDPMSDTELRKLMKSTGDFLDDLQASVLGMPYKNKVPGAALGADPKKGVFLADMD